MLSIVSQGILIGVIPWHCANSARFLPKVHLLGHCVAGDEHRSSELLMVDKSIFSVGLQTPGQKTGEKRFENMGCLVDFLVWAWLGWEYIMHSWGMMDIYILFAHILQLGARSSSTQILRSSQMNI